MDFPMTVLLVGIALSVLWVDTLPTGRKITPPLKRIGAISSKRGKSK